MSDDSTEHPIVAYLSKCKTGLVDDSVSPHRPRKSSRLNLNEATMSAGRLSSSSPSSSSSGDANHASCTQPDLSSTTHRERRRTSRAQSTLDVPQILTQTDHQAKVRKVERTHDRAMSSRRRPVTARKQTVQAKNIYKVTTESLLKLNVQTLGASLFIDVKFSTDSRVLSSLKIGDLGDVDRLSATRTHARPGGKRMSSSTALPTSKLFTTSYSR